MRRLGPKEESFQIVTAISYVEAEELLQAKGDFLASRTKARFWEEIIKETTGKAPVVSFVY